MKWLPLAALEADEVGRVLEDAQEPQRRTLDDSGQLPRLRVGAGERLGRACDRRQRAADLVAEAADQLFAQGSEPAALAVVTQEEQRGAPAQWSQPDGGAGRSS